MEGITEVGEEVVPARAGVIPDCEDERMIQIGCSRASGGDPRME